MGLETLGTTTTVNDFTTTWPVGIDNHVSGDNHLRLIKAALRQCDHLPTYADNAAAKTGGLEVGQWYKTSAGALMVVF